MGEWELIVYGEVDGGVGEGGEVWGGGVQRREGRGGGAD